MAITKKQKELDEIKWKKSEEQGFDACGSFDYCVKCDKSLENPCEKALKAFTAKPKKEAKPKTETKPKAAPAKKSKKTSK